MYWQDILIDKKVEDAQIVDVFSRLFSISPRYILIIEDISETNVDSLIKIIIERMSVKGDFSMRLAIYLRDSQLEQFDSHAVIGQLCEMLHCNCLMSNNSVNPYSKLLVRGVGDYQPVYLDADRLNDNDEYVISRYV